MSKNSRVEHRPIRRNAASGAEDCVERDGAPSYSFTNLDPEAFLQRLYGSAAPGHIAMWTRQDKRTRWFRADDLSRAARYAERVADRADVYFGVGLHERDLGPTKRGTVDSVVGLPGVWADIDMAGDDHAEDHLPPDVGAALSMLAEFPLKPSILIHTGHGLHAWWLFDEVWTLATSGDRERAQSMVRRFQACLRRLCTKRGWSLDNTSDLARVMRLPATHNHKSKPVPVRGMKVVWS